MSIDSHDYYIKVSIHPLVYTLVPVLYDHVDFEALLPYLVQNYETIVRLFGNKYYIFFAISLPESINSL